MALTKSVMALGEDGGCGHGGGCDDRCDGGDGFGGHGVAFRCVVGLNVVLAVACGAAVECHA